MKEEKMRIVLTAGIIMFLLLPGFGFARGNKEKVNSSPDIVVSENVTISDNEGDLNPELVESGDLLVFSYEETVTDFFLDKYREKYPDVNIRAAVYGELDEAIAKLRGGFDADVLNPGVDYLSLLQKLDLIQPIETKYIPRWNDLMEYFTKIPEINAGDGKVWMVPADAGLEGIMYNSEKIKTPIDSWKDLWNPEFKGHIAMQDYARNSIAVAALAIGYDEPFNLSDDQLDKIEKFLIEQKPLLLKYFEGDEEVDTLFSEGEVWISLGWSADARALTDEGIPVEFISPKEGALSWICGYSILKGTKSPLAAHALINHYIRPELQEYEAVDFEYFVPNSKVLNMLSQEEIDAVGLDKPEALENAHVEIIPDNYDRWLEVWETVKATQQ